MEKIKDKIYQMIFVSSYKNDSCPHRKEKKEIGKVLY